MIHSPAALGSALHWLGRTRTRFARSDDAGRRLGAARLRYEKSVTDLRKAALDHVDSQDLAGLVLRANLARLTRRAEAAG